MGDTIPVTLVTGFLGAGKTTLLEHILNTDTGLRWAIIENEFGNVGVDGSLVSAPSDSVFELNDGCVCCTVREDLLETFEQILARRSEFDHILIETTGLAEPEPVMRLFDRPSIRASFTLTGVVTLVDAHHLEQSLNEVQACGEQIAFADLLILNKTDGISEQALNALESRLRDLNPLATLCRAQHSKIDIHQLLELESNRVKLPDAGHHHHHHHHEHDESIRPVVVEASGSVNIDELDLWLGELARGTAPMLLRMKGILSVEHYAHRFVFNGVRTMVDVRPDSPWGSEARYNRIVLIGKGLDQERLQTEFDTFISQ